MLILLLFSLKVYASNSIQFPIDRALERSELKTLTYLATKQIKNRTAVGLFAILRQLS
jgi:hypothetical protein